MSPRAQRTFPLHQISASHPEARRYVRARRNAVPRQDRVTAVGGLWAHEFLLGTDARIEVFFWCPDSAAGDERTRAAEALRPVQDCVEAVIGKAQVSYQISERTLRRLHPDASPPAMLSIVRLPAWDDRALLSSTAGLVLVADGIEYAGNLGTLIRTVDACGAGGLVLTNAVARATHPKVFGASRGTVLTTPVLEYRSVKEAKQALVEAGFAVYIADPSAVDRYDEVSYDCARLAFVVGSEGEGVAPAWGEPGVERVAIPMSGRADSLNVAASAAILLFAARAQRSTALCV